MRTDKQMYKILEACPDWFFDLTQIANPGPCSFPSMALKEVEVTADGVLEPQAVDQPFFFVFQAQYDDSVYVRLVLEMALFQRHHPGRQVEGVILFLDSRLDPKTEPWRRVIRVYSVADQLSELQKRTPKRPLVSVFQPLTESSDENLALNAAECYHHIVDSELDSLVKNVLADVFVSWLEQRFRDKGKQEIEEMLVGALPDLTETQSGKDLIQIGVEKGKAEGKAEGKRDSLLLVLKVRFGRLPEDILQAIVDIESVERLEALTEQALQIKSLSEFDAKA